GVAGEMATLRTCVSATVMVEDPLMTSIVAVMVALPPATDATTPEDETVATAELELAQITVFPPRTVPAASFGDAASCCVWPATMFADAGVTSTRTTWPAAIEDVAA